MSLFLLWLCLLYCIKSETILTSQSSNYTLTLNNSPYIVNSYVTFSSSAHIVIENGVEIIFIGNKFISVFGSLNCGCLHKEETINNSTRGLSNTSLFIHIYGNASMPTSTGIFINQQSDINPGIIEFCNTLFENIQNGIVSTSNQYIPYTVFNCEFRSINNAIHHSTNIINYVFNSYFHQLNNVKSGGGIIYDNCLFDSFGKFSFNTQSAINIAIRNSEIHGDINIYSVAGDPMIAIYNNSVSECKDGIQISNIIDTIAITYNSITNCTRSALFINDINTDIDTVYISNNIFMNNDIVDVMIANINTVYIADNTFTNDISIYAVDIDTLSIIDNTFADNNAHNDNDAIVNIERCNDIYIERNMFINIQNGAAIYSRYGLNMNISSNEFTNNCMQYVITIYEIEAVIMNNNSIMDSLCTISDHLLQIINTNKVSLLYNAIQDNMNPFINIQNTNEFNFNHNVLLNNNNNNIDNNLLVYLVNANTAHISHNIFNENDVQNTLCINVSVSEQHIMIEYNDFRQSIQAQYSADYIQIIGTNTDNNININWNNFYNDANMQYLIHSQSININANSNYYSGAQITDKLNDICFIHMDNILITHCLWYNNTDCNHIQSISFPLLCDSDSDESADDGVYNDDDGDTPSPTSIKIIAHPPNIDQKIDTETTSSTHNNMNIYSSVTSMANTSDNKQLNFTLAMIITSICCAVLCLVSFEIYWCIEKGNRKKMSKSESTAHHLSISEESYDVNINKFAFHPNVIPHKEKEEDAYDEEEEKNIEDEVEGDEADAVVAPMKRYHVKDDTFSHNVSGEHMHDVSVTYCDMYGIQIADDEFIIGSLPEITQCDFGEQEYDECQDKSDVDGDGDGDV